MNVFLRLANSRRERMVPPIDTLALLRPRDSICLEGGNQKQAEFLRACLANADPKALHDLRVVQSGIVLPEHVDLFEKGIAKMLDFSFSGPQSEAVPAADDTRYKWAKRDSHHSR